MEDQIAMALLGVMEDQIAMSSSNCGMTTLMTIVCTPVILRRRYRMWRTLLLSIMHKLSELSSYFSGRYDTTSRIGLIVL
jgi:hypothetical protein